MNLFSQNRLVPPSSRGGLERGATDFAKTISLLATVMCVVSLMSSLFLVPFATATAAEPTPELYNVQPLTGPAFSGKLGAASADGTSQFTVAGQTEPRTLKLPNLVRWGEWRRVLPGPQVHLHDGGFIGAEVLAVTDTHLTADSINGLGEFKLPRAAIRAIVLQPLRWKEEKPKLAKDETPAKSTPETVLSSTLVLANGDRRAGNLAGWQPGIVLWQTGEQTLRVPLSSVVAVEFSKRTVSLDASAVSLGALAESNPNARDNKKFWLGFSDGSRILASSFLRDKQSWRIKLTAGGQLTAELDSLTTLQPLNSSRVDYLSDLPAAGYKSIPWLTTTWDYTRDRNVTGGELRVAGSLALKGLGMHSASRLTYDLDKKYSRFAARVGIDDSTAGRGHAIARIYGDRGDGKWELLAETPALRGGMPAVPLEAELAGLQRLALVVDFAGDGDAGDHLDWLDARLIRKAE
jgi:hypothetical protein